MIGVIYLLAFGMAFFAGLLALFYYKINPSKWVYLRNVVTIFALALVLAYGVHMLALMFYRGQSIYGFVLSAHYFLNVAGICILMWFLLRNWARTILVRAWIVAWPIAMVYFFVLGQSTMKAMKIHMS